MEYHFGIPDSDVDFISEETKIQHTREKMNFLAEQKFPVRKYNEYSEQYITVGEQAYEDALRDAYEEMEHLLDTMISRVRNGSVVSDERMVELQEKINHFTKLLPV